MVSGTREFKQRITTMATRKLTLLYKLKGLINKDKYIQWPCAFVRCEFSLVERRLLSFKSGTT